MRGKRRAGNLHGRKVLLGLGAVACSLLFYFSYLIPRGRYDPGDNPRGDHFPDSKLSICNFDAITPPPCSTGASELNRRSFTQRPMQAVLYMKEMWGRGAGKTSLYPLPSSLHIT